MSISSSSDEFAYRTRLVVYNFLGLVPAAPSQSEDDAESSQPEQQQQQLHETNPPSPWNDALGTLPTVSLIDRLTESEAQQMKMRMVCDEVADKVRRVEPVSSEPSKNLGNKHCERLDVEKAREAVLNELKHDAVLNELKQKVPDRSQSPNDCSADEMGAGTITIIQKRNRLRILGDSISSVEEADIRRRLSLQPFSAAARSSEVPFGRASVQLVPHSALAGTGFAFGGRTSAARRPTTLLSSSTPAAETALSSSRDMLSQIDEEHELGEANGCALDGDGPVNGASNRDAPRSVSVAPVLHFTPRPSSVHTPISIERQSSSWSGSSRRCSTYIDITEVDVESLVKSKTLPSVTVSLKRELSIAFEELGRSHQTGDDTFDSGPSMSVDELAQSPESQVADSLRALGDRIQEEYGSRLNTIVQDLLGSTSSSPSVNYHTMQNVTTQLLQQTQNGWTRVALMMLLGQHLVYELLRQGYTGISDMAEYTAKLVEDNAADFIVNNGGWNSISDIGVMETETSLSSTDIDFKMISAFNCSSGDGVESTDGAAALEATPFRNSVASESFQETFPPDDQGLVDSINSTKDENESSFVGTDAKGCSPADVVLQEKAPLEGMTVSPDTDPPTNQSIEGDAALLRGSSKQLMDETESARRTDALVQSGAFVGLALLTLLASWLLYQRYRRVT